VTARRRRLARAVNVPVFPEPFDCPCCPGGVQGGPTLILAHVAARFPGLAWRWEPAVDGWALVGERHVAVAEVAVEREIAWQRAA